TPNGLITFGTGDSQFTNSNLNTSPGEAAIAPLWDDWVTFASGTDQVLYKFDSGSRLIIEWHGVQHFSSSPSTVTFQAILQLNTGSAPGAMTFNYVDLDAGNLAWNNGASATVGIKNS